MKYVFGWVVMVLFSMASCSSDDDVQCLGDPIDSGIVFIELVNADGVNLLENGTYVAEDITVTFGDFVITEVVFSDILGLDNLIAVNVMGSDGDNTFNIQLSEQEEDILIMNLVRTEIGEEPCSYKFQKLNTLTYNGEMKPLEDFLGDFKITIVK